MTDRTIHFSAAAVWLILALIDAAGRDWDAAVAGFAACFAFAELGRRS